MLLTYGIAAILACAVHALARDAGRPMASSPSAVLTDPCDGTQGLLLNIALNKARSTGENLSFPLTNAPVTSSTVQTQRTWSFASQAVTAGIAHYRSFTV